MWKCVKSFHEKLYMLTHKPRNPSLGDKKKILKCTISFKQTDIIPMIEVNKYSKNLGSLSPH